MNIQNERNSMTNPFNYTHTLAECIGGREPKSVMGFCATPRCVNQRGQMVYRVKGIGRGVMRNGARKADACKTCLMHLFFSGDYYLVLDGREREVARLADGTRKRRAMA